MNKTLRMILATLVGAGIGFFGVKFGQQLATSPGSILAIEPAARSAFLWFPFWCFMAVLLHELGHMLAGQTQGMRLLFLTVGPFRARQTVAGLRFEWAGFSHAFGGLTAMMPNLQAEPSRQLRILVLGGPFVSLLLCALGASLLLGSGALKVHGLMLLLVNGFIFLITIVPMQMGPFLTDGAQYLALKSGSQEALVRHQVMALYGQSLNGVRPRDWDSNLLSALASHTPEDARQRAIIAYMQYQHALDAGQTGSAHTALDLLCANKEVFGAGYAQTVAAEAAYFHARYLRQKDSAERWLAQSRGGTVEPALRALANAAVAWLSGDAAGSREAATQGIARLSEGASAGVNVMLEAELRGLMAEIESAQGVPIPA